MENKVKKNCTFYNVMKETIENGAWCFRLPHWSKFTYANLSVRTPNMFLIHTLTDSGIKHKKWCPVIEELESSKYIVYYEIIDRVIAKELTKEFEDGK